MFIIVGFVFKRKFKEESNDKGFVLLNIYFLQPMLVFWGLTRAPISYEFIISPLIYFLVVFITLIIALIYAQYIFKNKGDKSIFLATSLVGNTGNLGIPLGIALFGIESVPYTSILNIANIFFIYIVSAYFFSYKTFNLKKSLISIFKIPAIGVALIALSFNAFSFTLDSNFDKFFTMGAYASMVIQLVIFGIYMAQVKVKSANLKLALNISLFKHIVLPAVGLVTIFFFNLSPIVAAILFLELLVPLAVNNVNLSALYDCNPLDTTFAVIISSIVFIILIYGYLEIFHKYFGI